MRVERLNNLVIDGAILGAVSFSIWLEILSGPLALETSRSRRNCFTSSTVQYISGGGGISSNKKGSASEGGGTG